METDATRTQLFTVTINWSPDSGGRVTEGDIREAIEQLTTEVDEEAVVDVTETIDTW